MPEFNKKTQRLKSNTDPRKSTISYLIAVIVGFYLSGLPGLVLGPLIRSKRKYWILWILTLLPLQIPMFFLSSLLGLYPKLVMSPSLISKYYECIPEEIIDGFKESKPQEQNNNFNKLSRWVAEKESTCSENKNYLFSKALVFIFEGNLDDAFRIIEGLYSKYPNDKKIQHIRKAWGIEQYNHD